MKNTTRVMAQLQRILNDIKERESVALNGEIPPFGEYISERDLRDAWEADDLVKATEGISNDYSNPMTEAERKRKGEAWLRRVYSSMVAIGDTVPSITMLRGSDLGIERERESTRTR